MNLWPPGSCASEMSVVQGRGQDKVQRLWGLSQVASKGGRAGEAAEESKGAQPHPALRALPLSIFRWAGDGGSLRDNANTER